MEFSDATISNLIATFAVVSTILMASLPCILSKIDFWTRISKTSKKRRYRQMIPELREISLDIVASEYEYLSDVSKMDHLDHLLDSAYRLTRHLYISYPYNTGNQPIVVSKITSEISGTIMKYVIDHDVCDEIYERINIINNKINNLIELIAALESKRVLTLYRILLIIIIPYVIIIYALTNGNIDPLITICISFSCIIVIMIVIDNGKIIKDQIKKYYDFDEKMGKLDKERKMDRYLESIKNKM